MGPHIESHGQSAVNAALRPPAELASTMEGVEGQRMKNGALLCVAKNVNGDDCSSKAQDGFKTCVIPRHHQQEPNTDEPRKSDPSTRNTIENAENTRKKVGKKRVEESKLEGLKCAAKNAKNGPCGNPAQAGSLACWIQSHQDQIAKVGLTLEMDLTEDGPTLAATDSDGVQITLKSSSKGTATDPLSNISSQARHTHSEDHSMTDFKNSTKEVQSLLAAHQRDREPYIQALHDAQAREQAERIRADRAEEQCKLLLQREEDNEARVATAHDDIQRTQQSEKEMKKSLLAMENKSKRLKSHSIGEEDHIRQLEQLVVKLEASLAQAEGAATSAKREAKVECLRANDCEKSLQVASDQVQQGEKRLHHLERIVETVNETRVKDQRRAQFAEKKLGRLSTLLAAKTSDKDPGAGRSQVSPANASHTDQIVQQLPALYAQMQELRSIINEMTSKLSQIQETGDLLSELKHIRTSAERQNAKLLSNIDIPQLNATVRRAPI